MLNPQIRPWRLGASTFTVFGLIAVALALVGLGSSVSYAVSQRTREFAVRLAIGAQPISLLGLVLRGDNKSLYHVLPGEVIIPSQGMKIQWFAATPWVTK